MELLLNRGLVYQATPVGEDTETYLLQCFGSRRKMYNLHVAHLYDYMEANDHQPGDYLPSLKKMGLPTVAALKKSCVGDDGEQYLYAADAYACVLARRDFLRAVEAFNKTAHRKQYRKGPLKRHKKTGKELTFRDLKGIPRFHAKKRSKASYTTYRQGNNIRVEGNILHLPVAQKSPLKEVTLKLNLHRPIPKDAVINCVTVSTDSKGRFHASINVEYTVEVEQAPIKKVLGIDLSPYDFFVDSTGRKANYPKFYKETEARLAKEQRILARMKYGSKRYNRQLAVVQRLHEKVKNQRNDWLHKKAFALADKYDMVVVEDLDLRFLTNNPRYAKVQQDCGFGNFRLYLGYKLVQRGKLFVKADKFYPSSQLCNKCGVQNPKLKDIKIRKWVCPVCGQAHDRDENAALNLQNYGYSFLVERSA